MQKSNRQLSSECNHSILLRAKSPNFSGPLHLSSLVHRYKEPEATISVVSDSLLSVIQKLQKTKVCLGLLHTQPDYDRTPSINRIKIVAACALAALPCGEIVIGVVPIISPVSTAQRI